VKALRAFLAAIFALGLTCTFSTAQAEEVAAPSKLTPEEIAAVKTQNEAIVAKTPQASSVFVVQNDGSVRHVQSGMICPAKYPNAGFYQLFVYAADGSDVGCDYRRPDDKGGAWSKLTIFATKAAPDMTLDRAFTGYHNEIVRSSPDAKSQGPAIREGGGTPPSSFPEIRSEEFVEPLNDNTYTSQLYVALNAGWIIEIRATFVGLPNKIEVNKEDGPDAAALAAGDRVMGIRALFDALGTTSH
jgi:hypothetical protein